MRTHLLAVLALGVTACDSTGNKAGGPVEPVELVLTNNDSGSGVLTTPAAGRFVELVEELSGGRLVVRVETGPWATDGQEIRDVAAGRADLGWTGTRVFDLLGVPELQPLHAPFLIDSFELQAAVLRSDVPGMMLPSLERLGVEPLAILGDGLRHPATSRAPLLSPTEWDGARIWLLDSGIQAEAVAALGGSVINGGDIRQMLVDGTADASETMWLYYARSADYLYAPYVAGNVVLSPRTTALFANPTSMATLDDDHREWIHQAAAGAVEWSADHAADDDRAYIADACQYGARIALATPDQLEALNEAVRPVYGELRGDDATAESMAAIENLKAQLEPPAPLVVPDGCGFEPADLDVPAPQPLTAPGPTGDLPLGTYRYELTGPGLVLAGDENSPFRGVRAGLFTWELGEGEWGVASVPSARGYPPQECNGWYAVDGATVTFTYDSSSGGQCLPPVWTVRWAPVEGGIQWGPTSAPALAPYFSAIPWERIG